MIHSGDARYFNDIPLHLEKDEKLRSRYIDRESRVMKSENELHRLLG